MDKKHLKQLIENAAESITEAADEIVEAIGYDTDAEYCRAAGELLSDLYGVAADAAEYVTEAMMRVDDIGSGCGAWDGDDEDDEDEEEE
ncbi:MAG: hypothetical protein OIF55_16715 [Amphritea sp.]|nr:hypothetical protein [Amphritea sp.]